MTRKCNFLCAGLSTTALLLAGTAGAMAQKVTRVPNDPSINGNSPGVNGSGQLTSPQLNQCWGQVASQIAQLDTTDVAANGGGMGVHSRAAAGQGTTFGDAFNFNTVNEAGNHGRLGVGNFTALPASMGGHNTSPGDGGNGVHANNAVALSTRLSPLTGTQPGLPGGTLQTCVP